MTKNKKKNDSEMNEEQLKTTAKNEVVNDEAANQEPIKTEEVEISEVDKLTNELDEAKDKYLRLYSEFDNYRRRTSKERLELLQTAGEQIIAELLSVLDDFTRAENATTTVDAEGMKLISQKFENILQNQGLKAMKTPVGSSFDPDLHEAITQIPAPKNKLKGKIVDTVENGYYLGEKVIRFAKVIIGN